MNIEESIITWVDDEIRNAKLKGMKKKQLKKYMIIAMKSLTLIAMREFEDQLNCKNIALKLKEDIKFKKAYEKSINVEHSSPKVIPK